MYLRFENLCFPSETVHSGQTHEPGDSIGRYNPGLIKFAKKNFRIYRSSDLALVIAYLLVKFRQKLTNNYLLHFNINKDDKNKTMLCLASGLSSILSKDGAFDLSPRRSKLTYA